MMIDSPLALVSRILQQSFSYLKSNAVDSKTKSLV